MQLLLALLTATAATSVTVVEAIRKCRYNCDAVYRPICGHDHRQYYYTFCNQEAMEMCNAIKGNNFTKIADGPCYPSARDWRARNATSDTLHGEIEDNNTELTTKSQHPTHSSTPPPKKGS